MGMVIFIIAVAALAIALIVAVQFPELADQVDSIVNALIYYMTQGMDIVWLFVPKTLTLILMSLAVAVELVVLGYKFVMWIVRKLPVDIE